MKKNQLDEVLESSSSTRKALKGLSKFLLSLGRIIVTKDPTIVDTNSTVKIKRENTKDNPGVLESPKTVDRTDSILNKYGLSTGLDSIKNPELKVISSESKTENETTLDETSHPDRDILEIDKNTLNTYITNNYIIDESKTDNRITQLQERLRTTEESRTPTNQIDYLNKAELDFKEAKLREEERKKEVSYNKAVNTLEKTLDEKESQEVKTSDERPKDDLTAKIGMILGVILIFANLVTEFIKSFSWQDIKDSISNLLEDIKDGVTYQFEKMLIYLNPFNLADSDKRNKELNELEDTYNSKKFQRALDKKTIDYKDPGFQKMRTADQKELDNNYESLPSFLNEFEAGIAFNQAGSKKINPENMSEITGNGPIDKRFVKLTSKLNDLFYSKGLGEATLTGNNPFHNNAKNLKQWEKWGGPYLKHLNSHNTGGGLDVSPLYKPKTDKEWLDLYDEVKNITESDEFKDLGIIIGKPEVTKAQLAETGGTAPHFHFQTKDWETKVDEYNKIKSTKSKATDNNAKDLHVVKTAEEDAKFEEEWSSKPDSKEVIEERKLEENKRHQKLLSRPEESTKTTLIDATATLNTPISTITLPKLSTNEKNPEIVKDNTAKESKILNKESTNNSNTAIPILTNVGNKEEVNIYQTFIKGDYTGDLETH